MSVSECELDDEIDEFWKDVKNLTYTLRPCYTLTQQLSKEDLLPSDAYKLWMQNRLQLVILGKIIFVIFSVFTLLTIGNHENRK